LSRAVLLLGWKWVSSLALGVTVWSSFTTRGGAPALRLWGHAARVALAARLLARHVGLREPEVAFSAGLLHDIGRAVLVLRHRSDADRIASSEWEEDLERERSDYGADHALIGRWLATAWRLPDALVETIARHHEPVGAKDPIDALAVVRLADRLMREAEEERAPGAASLEEDWTAQLPDPALADAWPGIVLEVREEGREFERLFAGAG
jgi:putative nucleotidyltransferase with HDIG domain